MSDPKEESFHAELPEWAQIQRKTFTRWCNQQLKPRNLEIIDLQVGLRDGVNLINLVEVLTQQPSPERYSKKPKIKIEMMENIGIGLRTLTQDGIKLVNIGNNDIYEGNIKLILGLIWSLILHYQISLDFQDDDDTGNTGSAKSQLQDWATDLINNLPSGTSVRNFTTDWNDGVALCSMVEAVAPGLCPEYVCLDPRDRLENAQLGLDRAELGLGVQKILEAEDLVNPNIDELSVLTYVSLLRKATPTIDLPPPDPLKIKISGPGTKTAIVNTPAQLFIDTSGAGFGRLGVEIRDCNSEPVPVEMWSKDNETTVQYTPQIPGQHTVHVTYNKEHFPAGDFSVKVFLPTDPTKVVLSGDGLEKAYVDKSACIVVDTSEAGAGQLEVVVVGPDGEMPVEIEEDDGGMRNIAHYTPSRVGPASLQISVKFAGKEVPGSPIRFVDVVENIDPQKIKLLNEDLDETVVDSEIKLIVCTAGAGEGILKVAVEDEDSHPLQVEIRGTSPDNREVIFTPEHPGKHHVSVTWSDQPVPGGKFHLEVGKRPDPAVNTASQQVICHGEDFGGNSPDLAADTNSNLVILEGDVVESENDYSPDIVIISESKPDVKTELLDVNNHSPISELNVEEETTTSDDIMILEESEPSAEDVEDGKEMIVVLKGVEGGEDEKLLVVEEVLGEVEEKPPAVVEEVLGEVEEKPPAVVEEVVGGVEEEPPAVVEEVVGEVEEEPPAVVEEVVGGVEEKSPVVEEMVGRVEEEAPVVEEVVSRVQEQTPVVKEVVSVVEEQSPVMEEVLMEEVQVDVEKSPLVVELELDMELEAESPEVSVEDVTKQEVSEMRSQPLTEAEPEITSNSAERVRSSLDPCRESAPETDVRDVDENEVDDVELKRAEESETPPKYKPISHVVSAVFLVLALLSSAGEEHLPTPTEAALSSLLLSYLLTYAAADQELLTEDELPAWLNALFNLAVCPVLVTYLGYSLLACWGVCNLGITLGVLLGVELCVLHDHLQPNMIAQGVAVTVGGSVLIYLLG